MNVEPVEDVDGPEVLGYVVPLELLDAFPQSLGICQLLEVRVVEPLLRSKGDLTLYLL